MFRLGLGQRDRQEEILTPRKEKGKGKRRARWACGRLVQGQAGGGGTVVRGPGQGASSELHDESGA